MARGMVLKPTMSLSSGASNANAPDRDGNTLLICMCVCVCQGGCCVLPVLHYFVFGEVCIVMFVGCFFILIPSPVPGAYQTGHDWTPGVRGVPS